MAAYLEDIQYASHYCEENVYQLARKFLTSVELSAQTGFVVFVSNARKAVPIWQQKLADDDDPVVWDYHVIFVAKEKSSALACVVDQDTRLGFPVDFSRYCFESFRPQKRLQAQYLQEFRVVPADVFVANFASDRSHMIDHDATAVSADDKQVVYLQPIPAWPAIRGEHADSAMNLEQYISMDKNLDPGRFGTVMNLHEFIAFGRS